MSTNSASGVEFTGTGARVHGDGLADDQAIADQLADSLAGVGVGDFAHLIGIEPDLALTAADHGRRKALLGGEVDPIQRRKSVSAVSWGDVSRKMLGAIDFIDFIDYRRKCIG
jgi:hypothetical protein